MAARCKNQCVHAHMQTGATLLFLLQLSDCDRMPQTRLFVLKLHLTLLFWIRIQMLWFQRLQSEGSRCSAFQNAGPKIDSAFWSLWKVPTMGLKSLSSEFSYFLNSPKLRQKPWRKKCDLSLGGFFHCLLGGSGNLSASNHSKTSLEQRQNDCSVMSM